MPSSHSRFLFSALLCVLRLSALSFFLSFSMLRLCVLCVSSSPTFFPQKQKIPSATTGARDPHPKPVILSIPIPIGTRRTSTSTKPQPPIQAILTDNRLLPTASVLPSSPPAPVPSGPPSPY